MKAIIAGAGIAGLSAAISVMRLGMEVEVYEAAEALKPVGAGISLTPNALAAMDTWGLLERIQQQGDQPKFISATDEHLQTVQCVDTKDLKARYGYQLTMIHRASLHEILLSQVPTEKIHLGKKVTGYEESADQVTLKFADGSTATGDLLIAADGIHSPIRKQMLPDTPLKYSGQTCWRGVVNFRFPEQHQGYMMEAMGGTYRFGLGHINKDQVYWFAVQKGEAGMQIPQDKVKAYLLDRFAYFDPLITDLIAATPEEQIIHTDLNDFDTPKKWHTDRVLLIGDAAHAMTPNMGQGGAQAIEDAWYLAELWNKDRSITENLAYFNKSRLPKVTHIVNNSRKFGKFAHNTFARKLVNKLVRMVPAKASEAQLDKVYKLIDIKPLS